MQELQIIEVRGQRVLTTKQIAEAYGTDPERIKLNYRYNKKHFEIGKHLIPIENSELREFKARYQFDTQFKYAKSLYLWTEKGALLHAKSLNTDKAWEVYDYLVDFYFRAKEWQESVISNPPRQQPTALIGTNENILAYNRGFLFGVFRAEFDNGIISLETIYSMLSDRSKQLIHRELLGLEATYE